MWLHLSAASPIKQSLISSFLEVHTIYLQGPQDRCIHIREQFNNDDHL